METKTTSKTSVKCKLSNNAHLITGVWLLYKARSVHLKMLKGLEARLEGRGQTTPPTNHPVPQGPPFSMKC